MNAYSGPEVMTLPEYYEFAIEKHHTNNVPGKIQGDSRTFRLPKDHLHEIS